MLWIRGLQIPWFDRSNLFLRRITNPSGRLTGGGMPSGVCGMPGGGMNDISGEAENFLSSVRRFDGFVIRR